jgi:hypothetical protein
MLVYLFQAIHDGGKAMLVDMSMQVRITGCWTKMQGHASSFTRKTLLS